MTLFSTCDFCDMFRDGKDTAFQVFCGSFRSYGGKESFFGPAVTVQCYEDNSKIKELLATSGEVDHPTLGKVGSVLVVDGGASHVKALLGGNIAAGAARAGWSGIIINGCVRDLAELKALPIGILALGHVPMPTVRREQGVTGVPVSFMRATVSPGDFVYADSDGVVSYPRPIATKDAAA